MYTTNIVTPWNYTFSELWISLEEHQDALELIMSKYRKHMLQLMMKRKDVDAQSVLQVHHTQSAVRHYNRFSRVAWMCALFFPQESCSLKYLGSAFSF